MRYAMHAVARKISKHHAANKIQKELVVMNSFVKEQQSMRITSRGMLDRIAGIHEMMARELFEEIDEDNSGASA